MDVPQQRYLAEVITTSAFDVQMKDSKDAKDLHWGVGLWVKVVCVLHVEVM